MTVLVDSSAWLEYLRNTGSPTDARMREMIVSAQCATTDPILLEVVGGGRSHRESRQLARLLATTTYIAQRPREDVLAAATIYRACRSAGATVRALNDCLIAAIAIRTNIPVLHCNRDFDVLAEHTTIKTIRA